MARKLARAPTHGNAPIEAPVVAAEKTQSVASRGALQRGTVDAADTTYRPRLRQHIGPAAE